MEAATIRTDQGQIVDLTLADGARIRVHIISVDPDQFDNQVIYDVLEVRSPEPAPEIWNRTPSAIGAQQIVEVQATDGQRYLRAPSSSIRKPWWRFWERSPFGSPRPSASHSSSE
jgi:hypothetical protein